MQISSPPELIPAARLWTGIILTGLVCLFLAFDGIAKVMQVPQVTKASAGLGLPPATTVPIGVLLLACTAVYAWPKTAVLGAILLTGYLGGAIAIQLRAGGGAFPIVFSATFGVLTWVGLFLREPGLLALVILRRW